MSVKWPILFLIELLCFSLDHSQTLQNLPLISFIISIKQVFRYFYWMLLYNSICKWPILSKIDHFFDQNFFIFHQTVMQFCTNLPSNILYNLGQEAVTLLDLIVARQLNSEGTNLDLTILKFKARKFKSSRHASKSTNHI